MSLTRRVGSVMLFVIAAASGDGAAAADPVRDLVARIIVNQRPPNFLQPWTKAASQEVSGSGFVIEGRRILTNAHVVQYASQIYVQPHQSADKLSAKVIAASPDIDLAILKRASDDLAAI